MTGLLLAPPKADARASAAAAAPLSPSTKTTTTTTTTTDPLLLLFEQPSVTTTIFEESEIVDRNSSNKSTNKNKYKTKFVDHKYYYDTNNNQEEEQQEQKIIQQQQQRLTSTSRATTATTITTTCFKNLISSCTTSCFLSTIIGSCVFLIYQVVFCLAQAATITAAVQHSSSVEDNNSNNNNNNLTGLVAKVSALGVIIAGPYFIYQLGSVIPALYPASDLFLAPFLAQIAEQINTVLITLVSTDDNNNNNNNRSNENMNELLLSTFIIVTAISFLLSGCLCIIASKIKLANLGLFLPYSVLCGFFTTIGILMWTLGFNVDTGTKIQDLFRTGNNTTTTIQNAFLHHTPSLIMGIIMHIVSKKNPIYVVLCILTTVLGSYIILWITNTSLQEATDNNWFYSVSEFVPTTDADYYSTKNYGPPMPFGLWVSFYHNSVIVWKAVIACSSQIISLALLYLIRCSLHSAAVKKNIPNVTRKHNHSNHHQDTHHQQQLQEQQSTLLTKRPFSMEVPDTSTSTLRRLIGGGNNQNHDYFTLSPAPPSRKNAFQKTRELMISKNEKQKQKEQLTLNYILEHGYGYSQIISALVGGIAVAPSVAASITLFRLGAGNVQPQYGSCIALILFYMTDFRLVQYIPKPAFSCLMVLASIDMCRTWMIGSFYKTKDKVEWMVTPFLVFMAFAVGMLPAIFAGICASTFIFTANFYRAGTIKFVGSGLSLRSTVERGLREAAWLDTHADLIQILVLQNYLFFGNIQSLSLYIVTMFEDDDEENIGDATTKIDEEYEAGQSEYSLPPKPKYLVLDFTMVTGMDTSAVDMLRELIDLCRENRCNLFLVGLSSDLRSMLMYAGIKPEKISSSNDVTTIGRFAFVVDLETALAKAEDGIISNDFHWVEKDELETTQRQRHRSTSNVDDGFLYALQKIDEQHGLNTTKDLIGLREYTTPTELKMGDILARDGDHNGLYFVETGLLRVQHTTGVSSISVSRGLSGPLSRAGFSRTDISDLGSRTNTIGRMAALWKQEKLRHEPVEPTFRFARFGQGWVIGSIEASNGMDRPGVHVAVTDCRLHHLSYSAIQETERKDPTLTLHLYKLLSLLATKRQESTINQLAQFVKIMTNPVPRLRGGKKQLAKFSLQHI